MSVCCEDDLCCSPVSTTYPGPAGADGSDGATGAAGVNAYSSVANYSPAAQPTMPPEGGNVDVVVSLTAWMVVGQPVYVQTWGTMFVAAIINSNTVTLTNPEVAADEEYLNNAAPGTPLPASSKIAPGGWQGPQGTTPGGTAPDDAKYILKETDADLPNAQSLGALSTGMLRVTVAGSVGTLSIGTPGLNYYAPGMGVAIPVSEGGTGETNASDARDNLGLEIGADIMAFNDLLQNIALEAPTVADRFIYTTGVNTVDMAPVTPFARTLLDDADANAMKTTLGIPSGTGLPMLLFQHRENSGDPGGAFNAGSFVPVPLNTEVVDTGGFGSISGNNITLAAGTYRFDFGVLGYSVGIFKGRLWNVTDGSVVQNTDGSDAVGNTGNAVIVGANVGDISFGQGRFTLGISKVIRLESRGSTTNGTDGFGQATSFGQEVYSWLRLEKE